MSKWGLIAGASAMALLLIGLSQRLRAQGDFIPAGIDAFQTLGCDSLGQPHSGWDFGYRPIPAGFFHPLSEDFTGWVNFMGKPLDVDLMSAVDTRVSRGPVDFGDIESDTATASTWIQMIELSTQSIDLIQVRVDGWLTQLWYSQAYSGLESAGSMTITRTHRWLDGEVWRPAAGTWESQLPVRIVFDFYRLADPSLVVSTPPLFVDTVSATGAWISNELLELSVFVEPGTEGFVPCVSGYPGQQYIEPFYGRISESRSGDHTGSCSKFAKYLPQVPGPDAELPSETFVAGTWDDPADLVILADQQPDSFTVLFDDLFAYRLQQDTLYINGRAIGSDCRAFTQVEDVCIPVATDLYTFDPPAGSLDDSSVNAALIEVGLRSDQIELLRQNGPPSPSGITAVLIAEGVIDSAAVGGRISYYFDGYKTAETSGFALFDQGEPIKYVNVLYEDSWCTGLAILCCVGMRGNVDGEAGDQVNVADLTYLVDYLFMQGPTSPCFDEGDVNGDGDINVADLSHLVDYVFRGGSAPAPCP